MNKLNWKLFRSQYELTDKEKETLENFPFDEIASLSDSIKIMMAVDKLINNKNLVRKILETYIDCEVLDDSDVFSYLIITKHIQKIGD